MERDASGSQATWRARDRDAPGRLGILRSGTPAPAPHQAVEQRRQPRFRTLKRLAMAAATAFVSFNIWLGAPLLALWVGSQASDQAVLSIKAVAVVVIVLAVLVFALSVALTWLNNTYDELIGRPRVERRAPWLRSMRAEAEGHISSRVGITALERIVMVTVYVAATAFIVWLIFFAPGRTGDSEPRPATQLRVQYGRLVPSAAGDRPDVSAASMRFGAAARLANRATILTPSSFT